MTHTPGPWRVHSEHADRIVVNGCCVYQVRNMATNTCYEYDGLGPPNPDDVRLMAAAPELLSALRAALASLQELDGGWRDMDATLVDQIIATNLYAVYGVLSRVEGRADEQATDDTE